MENEENSENVTTNSEIVVCHECGQEINRGEAREVEIESEYYCEDCYNENFTECCHCGEVVRRDEIYVVDDDVLCEDCANELISFCDVCNQYHYNDEIRSTNDGGYICNNCLESGDSSYTTCDDCGDVFNYYNEGLTTHDGNHVCDRCADNYFYCAGCEEYYHEDECNEHDGNYYCNSCYEEIEDDDDSSSELRNFSYKPTLKIFKTGKEKEPNLYIGFELETERDGSQTTRDEICRILNSNINKNDTFIYFKRDGSLICGVEVVSHAFTWEYFKEKEQQFESILQILSNEGYKSHDTRTCGLHVHINRKYFGNTTEEQNENIDKMILFFEYFKDEIKTFSRRSNYNYCHFLSDSAGISDKKSICNTKKIKELKNNFGRYMTINVENSNTVEIRVFKGTLKKESFFASLEFVFNLARIIKNNDLNGITFSKVVNYEGSKYIKNYCKERGIKYNYDCIKDYSIQYLKEKQRLEKQANPLIKNSFALAFQIQKLIKKDILNIQKEIERKLENNEKLIKTFERDDVEKLTAAYTILRSCYILQNEKYSFLTKNNSIYYIISNIKELLKRIYNEIKSDFQFCDNVTVKVDEISTILGKMETLQGKMSNYIN